MPEGFDGSELCEKAMPANVEAISTVLRRPRNAANNVIGFKDGDANIVFRQ